MFTAIFCSRVVFDLFERKRRLKSLKMMRVVGETHIDFIGKRKIAAVASTLLIITGLVAVVGRRAQIFDIDFAGGTSVTMVLEKGTDETTIRKKLKKAFDTERVEGSTVQYSVNRVDVEGQDDDTVWKIDSSFKKADKLQGFLQEEFPVATFSMAFGKLTESRTVVPATPKKEEGTEADEKEPAEASKPKTDDKPDVDSKETAPEPAEEDTSPEEPKEASKPSDGAKDDPTPSKPKAAEESKAEESGDAKPEDGGKEEPKPSGQGAMRTDLPPHNVLAFAGDGALLLAQADPKEDAPGDAAEAKTEDAKAPADEEPVAAEEATPAEEETAEPKSEAPTTEKPAEKPSATPADAEPEKSSKEKIDEAETPKPAEEQPTEKPEPAKKPEPKDEPASSKDEPSVPEGKAPDAKPAEEPSDPTEDKPASDKPGEEPADATPPKSKTDEGSEEGDQTDAATPPKSQRSTTQSELTFEYEINGLALKDEILAAAGAVDVTLTEEVEDIALQPIDAPDGWLIQDSTGFTKWDVSLATTKEKAEAIFQHMKKELDDTPYWLSSSAIGGKVAGDTRTLAIAALLTSLFGIVGYIWIRFQRVVFGLAAVVALVHDVLITLGAIAVSYWLAGAFGFLLIEEFKISLPVVAAFLTIIGYSLNDTIVVFDRIREVRGKSPDLTNEMVNTSINQTLGRTILTSLTTFLVVLILYTLGGQGIHGFAFALVIGVIVGTYSSIFVASPALLWMSQAKKTA